jgi:hypothetical protein
MAVHHQKLTITVSDVVATSEAVDYRNWNGGRVKIVSGAITTMTFHTSDLPGGTFTPAYTAVPAAVALTTAAAREYELPADIVSCGAFKITGNVAGVVEIMLKDG